MTTPAPAQDDDPAVVRPPRPGWRGALIMGAAWVVARLPEAPLVAAAESVGELWYRASPAKRAQARASLRRVCEGLAATGRGSPRSRRAATDPDVLERIVRASFRHAARYYLEAMLTGAMTTETALARVEIETPDEVAAALRSGEPAIIVGMHFGAIELPVIVVSHFVRHAVTAPMEEVADPGLAHWFTVSRSRVGVRVVSLANARVALLRALRRGESVGIVADRDITGSGIMVPFFGHPTPIPVGPAMLALETGVPVYVASARRTRGGRYAGRLIHVAPPEGGSRRERVTAFTAAIAAAFETTLADAPEQWWGAFHAFWPDIALHAPATTRDAATP